MIEDNLPDGWTEHYSTEHKKKYYYDTINKITQWAKPTKVAKGKMNIINSEIPKTIKLIIYKN